MDDQAAAAAVIRYPLTILLIPVLVHNKAEGPERSESPSGDGGKTLQPHGRAQRPGAIPKNPCLNPNGLGGGGVHNTRPRTGAHALGASKNPRDPTLGGSALPHFPRRCTMIASATPPPRAELECFPQRWCGQGQGTGGRCTERRLG